MQCSDEPNFICKTVCILHIGLLNAPALVKATGTKVHLYRQVHEL